MNWLKNQPEIDGIRWRV